MVGLYKWGVGVDCQDLKGSTPLIAASQHNHLRLVAYLLAAGAKWELTDCNGDTALHWAAYNGYVELMRMLINTGLNPQQPDRFGHTPLHLACLGGPHSEVPLQCRDLDGLTPLQLADCRNHTEVSGFLRMELRARSSLLPSINIRNFIFGPPGKSKGPLLFFLLSLFFWGYPMYLLRCVPLTWHTHPRLHAIFLCANGAMWVGLVAAHTRDPGFLPRDDPQYLAAVRRPDTSPSLLARLCHSCRALRPLRAKHCRACGRCVLSFDHHCPYIYNCVGLRNRVWFLMFATMVAVNCSLTVIFAGVCIAVQGWQSLYIAGLLEAIFFCGLGWLITGATLYNAAMNLTTNEVFNYKRYQYLKDDKGKYKNPFSRGVLQNLADFFLCSQDLQQDHQPNSLFV
ncbi:hypothetical protein LAZ67_13001906 [Cordylochernes scorpioides]|uniref:Palmitoyltransferase n=1 Tax=Cordylochernes scorpioides TaxID=51811 RepID=A0ABY6L481_9ARAC|nr:hypothetical protein LAZ67_13001906 [Cordylochernes scorpioides]